MTPRLRALRPILLRCTVLAAVIAPLGGTATAEDRGLRGHGFVVERAATIHREAGDTRRRSAAPERGREFKLESNVPRFRHEFSRVGVQLESLSAFHTTTGVAGNPIDQVMFEEIHDDVLHGARRATRRALRDYLWEAATFDRKVDDLKTAHRGTSESRRKRVDVDVGVHSGMPEVEMKYRFHDSYVKLSLEADGHIGLKYRGKEMRQSSMGVSFDGDDTYRFFFQLGF